MLALKRKRLLFTLLLALIGAGYFSAMSTVEVMPFLKSSVALLPIQVGALIYLFLVRRDIH
jgi:hypothetical protein